MALVALAVVCAVVAGVRLYALQPHLTAAAAPADPSAAPPIDSERISAVPVSNLAAAAAEEADGWTDRLSQIDALKQVLQTKRSEILQLKQNYQYGILELEDEIKHLIKHARIDSCAQALKNSEIDWLLQNIQRRQAYSEALEKPLQWIDGASEELLHLQRRAAIDLLVKDIAVGIDCQRHFSEIDHALERHQPTPARLAVETGVASGASREVVCKRLVEQAKSMTVAAGDRRNQEIVAELCSGNLTRTAELSKLSLKGARCLAESGAKQLFLNRLAEMSPLAAKKLSEWPGQWLCLNGLSRLDPEVAAQLSAWRGQWLSINGLGELPAEAGRRLAGWSGQQLELMGLRQPAGVGHLAHWEAAGGRLFVPDTIRGAIDQGAVQPSGDRPAW